MAETDGNDLLVGELSRVLVGVVFCVLAMDFLANGEVGVLGASVSALLSTLCSERRPGGKLSGVGFLNGDVGVLPTSVSAPLSTLRSQCGPKCKLDGVRVDDDALAWSKD